MNGVDYSKALARERENYQTTMQRDRAQGQQLIADNEERHKKAQKRQYDNFNRDRVEMQDNYSDKVDKLKEQTRAEVDEQKQRFSKITNEEQRRFNNERSQLKKDFDDRFTEIRDSYGRAFDGQRKYHNTVEDEQSKRYNQNVKRVISDKDARVAEFQERMMGAGANLREENKREKAIMTSADEAQVEDIYKTEAHKRFLLKEGLHKDLERTNEAHRAEAEQQQLYLRDKTRGMSQGFNDRAIKMTEDYAKKNEELVDRQSKESFQTSKEHNAQLAEVRRGYEKTLRNIDIDKRRQDNGDGEYSEIVKRQQGLKDDQIFQDRIARLKTQNVDDRRNYSNRLDQETETYKEAVHLQSSEAAERRERVAKELTADKIVAVSNEREKANRLHSTQQASAMTERNRLEEQILDERNFAGNQVKKLKENFNKSLQDLVQKNEKFAKELKAQSDQDKSSFIIESNKQRNEEIHGLRRNFNRLMDTTVTEYETKLASAQRENSQLRDELDQKVGFILADTDRQLRQQAQDYEDKRKADMKASQMLRDQRETNLRNKILEVSNSYQRKMDQQTYTSEMKHKNTVSAYEARIKEMELSNAKNIGERENLHANELKRLKAAMEQEKAQLISQYENQINQLKLSYQQKFDQLNEYKRLG